MSSPRKDTNGDTPDDASDPWRIPGHFTWAFEYSVELMEKTDGHPFTLPEPYRTVLLVNEVQSKIDNGYLDYFYENEYEGMPSYDAFVTAYRNIGADDAADRLAASLKCFPFDNPHADYDARFEFISSRYDSGDELDRLSRSLCGDETVWRKLYDYIAEHFEAFSYD